MVSDYEVRNVGGARVATHVMPHVESVSLGLWFGVGSRYEMLEEMGVAHFLEHMVFKGTGGRSARQLTEEIEGKGGDLNAFTSEEMTCFFARLDGDHVNTVCDVLFDMMTSSTFPAEEVERERGVIQEELRMYDDQPHVVAHEALNGLLWKGNALGRPVAGTEESVAGLKRDGLMHFWKSNYRAGSLVVSAAGEVIPRELDEMILAGLDGFGKNEDGKNGYENVPKVWEARNVQDRVRGISKEVQQVNVALGFPGLKRRDARRYAERLLHVILGGNMSSRLFQVIREDYGLAYSVNTSVAHFHDAGAFYVMMGLDGENLAKAVKLVHMELLKVVNDGVCEKELQRAKDYLVGQLKLNLESTSSQMMWMGESLLGLGEVPDPHEVMGKIKAVRTDDVQSIARDLFQVGRAHFVCVGDGVESAKLGELITDF